MLFKVINKDKVKIIVEKDDLKNFSELENDIINNFSSEFLAEILIGIYEKTGIDFLSSKIYLETFRGISDSYYIIVSRIIDSGPECVDRCEYDEVDMYIFELNGIETVFDVAEIIKKYKNITCYSSRLFEYRKKEYLCLYFRQCDVKLTLFDNLITEIEGVAKRCKWNVINESVLYEWGDIIADDVIKKITEAN